MAGAGEEPDEFTELFGFLSDARADVRKMAAEGALAQTETQEFVEYAQKNARKVARPLLRLAERAEADFIGSTAAASGASGTTEQRERAIRAAKIESSESLEAGSAALQALVNCSSIPQVRDQLIEMSAIRRCCESLRGGWLEGRTEFSHWHAMLLANLSTAEAGQKAVCADEGLFLFLVSAYVTKPRPPPRDGHDDTLFCLGKVACNVCALPEGRASLTAGDNAAGTLTALVVELGDRERRPDVLAIFRNLCADEECHEVVVQLNLMQSMAPFLYPWEKAAPEKRDTLPEELRKSLEAEGATMTADGTVRAAAANCIVGLCRTEIGRAHLRTNGCYEVIRAWHLEETDEEVKQAIEMAVPAVHLSEGELLEDKRAADAQQTRIGSVAQFALMPGEAWARIYGLFAVYASRV